MKLSYRISAAPACRVRRTGLDGRSRPGAKRGTHFTPVNPSYPQVGWQKSLKNLNYPQAAQQRIVTLTPECP
ncbi:hypothetical protein I5R65_22780 [Herbaspirillum sp. AP02]|uniref:hypothetical protein n=1 Tax=Herbaspirillum sp. AP02 TaxID=2790969 RepID=UPI0018CBC933|nr:hypothetical protein [Herbaspirillum sp. AP02]MBG7622309.1 hypothetical protein [Herbaspirillum sp. AP02]